MQIETDDAQNTIARIDSDIYLNVSNPSAKLKRQYHRACKAISDAKHELDIVNDMKDELQANANI